MSYRQALRELEAAATPASWAPRGEFYGVVRAGHFRALGFAPHHPFDPMLIATYRNSLRGLVDAIDAVEHQAARATADKGFGAGAGITGVLDIVDSRELDGEPLISRLRRLHAVTTQPPWDLGHLALGMDILEQLVDIDRLPPAAADPYLIAAARSAIPRGLDLLIEVASLTTARDRANGSLEADAATTILEAVARFDSHRADEGAGTSTV